MQVFNFNMRHTVHE